LRPVGVPITGDVALRESAAILTEKPFQLPDGSRAILEAAGLLDQPFSVPLLIGLAFSADALDPFFDGGIFREPFPNRGAQRVRDAFAALALAREAAEKTRHVGLLSEILAFEGFISILGPLTA
jgi:hypothetical protein